MGLDIYLHPAADAARNDDYNVACEALYTEGPDGKTPRDLMSDEQYAEWSTQHYYVTSEDPPSERYPDHLFNRRYLRSSYNGGGFNHAVLKLLGTSGNDAKYPDERGSLYWIFEPMGREWDGDEGTLTADDVDKLRASKARALEVADELRKCDRLRVLSISPNLFGEPPTTSDDEALKIYRDHVGQREIKPDDWYSTNGGNLEVFGDGLKILAAIPGKATFGIPGVHLIYRATDDGYESYIQSAEITAEFCDEAIALIERDGSCSMTWSG